MLNNMTEKVIIIQERLKVILINKPGFVTKTALLSFPIGGLNQAYIKDGVLIPFEPGAAHFLEHKCFEDEGVEITAKFSKLSASANAFTSNTQTVYYFKTIDHFLENLEILMTLAFQPNFTEAGIEKERGIIMQEMASSHDKPFYKQYKKLMDVLYKDHPFAHDIIGDENAIQSISYETLKTIHETYYQPEYATLILGGDDDFESVIQRLETFEFKDKIPFEKAPILNVPLKMMPPKVQTIQDDVLATYVLTGFRLDLDFETKKEEYAFSIALETALDVAFGPTSDWYEKHNEKDIITESFFHDVNLDPQVSFVMMMSQTRNEAAFLKAMDELIEKDQTDLFNENDFNRIKKAVIGDYILGSDSLNHLVVNRAYYVDDDLTRDDFFKMQKAMTFKDVLEAFKIFQTKAIYTSVVLSPNKVE